MQITDKLMEYIQDSPNPYHTAAAVVARLEAVGFTCLEENAPWVLSSSQCCYTIRNQSGLIAFRLPGDTPEGWRMTAAHSDSPTFYVKNDVPEGDRRYVRLAVEGYGGMNYASWLNRPLTVADRVVVCARAGVEGCLVYLDRDLPTIPSLAIHQQRDVNRGHDYNAQKDTQPLYALGSGPPLTVLLAGELGVDVGDILATDLVLCPRQVPVRIGPEGEFSQVPRTDDLDCAYATPEGFLSTRGMERSGQLYYLSDNEEVGSGTYQGAISSFLPDVLTRIGEALGLSAQACRRALAGSLFPSVDDGHAVHPNFPEKADPANKVYPNGSVVTKYSADQKHTTTDPTVRLFQAIRQKAGVPVQVFADRANEPGGSALGNLLGHQVSTLVMDIVMAQLAIYSAMETVGSRDPEYMARVYAAFFQAEFTQTIDGVYQF